MGENKHWNSMGQIDETQRGVLEKGQAEEGSMGGNARSQAKKRGIRFIFYRVFSAVLGYMNNEKP